MPPSQPKAMSSTVFWRLAEDIPKPLNTALVITSIGGPLLLWWLVTTFGNVDPQFLPSPAKVLQAFSRLWSSGELLKDTVASLWRVGVGFLLAVVFSIPVGVLMGSFASIRALLEPLFGLMRYMPAPAFIPLLILYLGIRTLAKLFCAIVKNLTI